MMQCRSCQLARINGIVCHETGCPDAWRDEERECKECGCDFEPDSRWQTHCDGCWQDAMQWQDILDGDGE